MKMNKTTSISQIMKLLGKQYKTAKISLNYSNPVQLLVSVMLSAQCTDVRVNIVTKELFKKYKTARDFANADIKQLEKDVKSTGFYRSKAGNIKKTCTIIVDKLKGKVPDKMEELVALPGVGRKTANIVLSNAYGVNVGIAVDTHVKRLSGRLGFTKNIMPEKIEKNLMELVPKKDWNYITYLLIEHGRAVCKAPTPICSKCILYSLCPRNGVSKYK